MRDFFYGAPQACPCYQGISQFGNRSANPLRSTSPEKDADRMPGNHPAPARQHVHVVGGVSDYSRVSESALERSRRLPYSKSLYGHYHPELRGHTIALSSARSRRTGQRKTSLSKSTDFAQAKSETKKQHRRSTPSDIRATRFSRQILKTGGVPDTFRTKARTPRTHKGRATA
jgi:hypothetical protein